MFRSAACVTTFFTAILGFMTVASADPVTASRLHRAADDPDAYLIDGHYLRDEGRIANMRANGELPDSIKAGKCTYELAGDPSVVYYVRTCP